MTATVNTGFFDRILSDLFEEIHASVSIATEYDDDNSYLFATAVNLRHNPLFVKCKVPLANDTTVLEAVLRHQIRSDFIKEVLKAADPREELYWGTIYRIELEVRWSSTDPDKMEIDRCTVSTRYMDYQEQTLIARAI